MNILLDLTNNIRDTAEAIAKHERAIAATSASPALTASLRSLEKRMQKLEAEFAAYAADQGVDVCRYRIFADYVQPAIRPVCSALLHFQQLYTLAYDAVKNGVKQIARTNDDIIEQTKFGFGYSFAGSVGIVLTFENRKLDLFESYMDEAMKRIFALAQSTTPSEVAAHGMILGRPAVREAHAWASDHAQYGIGADITWVRNDLVKDKLFLDANRMSAFVDVLNNTSELKKDVLVVDGIFAGGEAISKHQFHFIDDNGVDYKGTFNDAINESSPVQIPRRYRATIQRTSKIFYTTEREDSVAYFLENLTPIN